MGFTELGASLGLVPALLCLALVAVPPLTRLAGRNAGYPLAALFLATAALFTPHLGPITGGTPWVASHPWIPHLLPGGAPATLALRADPLSTFFALLALLIGAVVFIYSARYLHGRRGSLSFYLLMTAFMASVVTLVLADDVVLLFTAWELVSLASFFLIARSGPAGERGSLRTIILTFFGGLTLAIALGIACLVTGSTSISEIIASPAWDAHPTLLAVAAVLMAISACTKAAQFPFHFWLPEAMAAETPVSAFLHAAAVVKAGIYVLLRFSPLFTGVGLWHGLLTVVGMLTAIMGALFALQKTDLKKLTAYSTVSQLGWIVCMVGIGTPLALAAALLHTLAHALFKSSLFMLVGVIDHQTGTRDLRRLGPIWRAMPYTFASATVAACSMAALPPLFGFVTKEQMIASLEHNPLLVVCATVGAILTFAYSFRYLFGGFVDGPRPMPDVHDARPSLWLPAALPGLLSLPLGLAPSLTGHFFDAVVEELTHAPYHSHLALWHGVGVPVVVTALVVAAGVAMVGARRRIAEALVGRRLWWFSGADALQVLVRASMRVGVWCARMADSLSPTRHVAIPLAAVVALGGAVAANAVAGSGGVDGVPAGPRVPGVDRPMDAVALLMVVVGVAATVRARRRLSAIIAVSATGVGVTLQMLTLGAPDVALTQILVEILTTAVMALVVRLQPRLFAPVDRRRSRLAAVLAAAVGVTTTAGVWALVGHHGKPELAQWYLTNGPSISHGQNVVNTILVEFRALDTMGELSVLGMCGVAIAAVVGSVPRLAQDLRGRLPRMPYATLNAIPLGWLRGILVPVLILLSAAIFWRGHNHPGGGFIAALVGGGALMLNYMALAHDPEADPTSSRRGRLVPYVLVGLGICLAVLAGVLGYLGGHHSFLEPLNGHVGPEFVTTAQIFDAGVYVAVLGLVAIALIQLGGPGRPGAPRDAASEGEAC